MKILLNFLTFYKYNRVRGRGHNEFLLNSLQIVLKRIRGAF